MCFKCGKISHEAKECDVLVIEGEDLPYGDWLKAGFRRRATGSSGSIETRTRNDPTDTHFTPTKETGDDRVPLNSHEATKVSTNTNQTLVLTEDNASFGKNNISADFMAITQFSQKNRTERDSRDPIPNILKVDITPKETSFILGPIDMGGVISEMTTMHSGLFSVPISFMQPTIVPMGLDGVLHDKGTV